MLMLLVCQQNVVAGVVFYEDFDSYAPGPAPNGPPNYWVETNGGITIEVTSGVYCPTPNNSIHFLDTTSAAQGRLQAPFTPSVSVELECYIRSDNSEYEGVFVGLRSSEHGAGEADFYVGFGNESGGGQAGYIGILGGGGGWVKPDLLAYEEGAWYYVRRDLDCVTNEGTFYVEEVGNPSNNASYSIGMDYTASYVDEVDLWSSGSQGADAYVDTIRVIPEPATVSLLALGGFALLRRRRG
ncbi:MAG: PEP-CTERM sorting domain-containing protein [Phycisphaerae bacterium]|nr:PEP-CTERM sorting domain-containing protein [Phycisphaerae bacterium]